MNDEQEQRWASERKRCAARFAWGHREELTPNKVRIGEVTKRITWARWFQQHYGQTLNEYIAEVSREARSRRSVIAAADGSEDRAQTRSDAGTR